MTFADQAYFNNYNATTYGWPQGIPPLVPLEFDGVNFGQCARDAHPAIIALLTALVPHIPGGLRAGKCWGFSTTDDLPDGSWSMHHRGLAVDVNWDRNPMGTYATNPYAGQVGAIPQHIASSIARSLGFEYGGDWSGGEGVRAYKDYMHFELHLSPSVARTVTYQGDDDVTPEQLRAELTNFFHGKDGKPYGIESLIREALAPEIAELKTVTAQLAAVAKKVGAA